MNEPIRGQAPPELFARWVRSVVPGTDDDAIAQGWRAASGTSRDFWMQLAAAVKAARDGERERIRQLAIKYRAMTVSQTERMMPFEEMLRRSPEENAAALLQVVSSTGETPAQPAPELTAAMDALGKVTESHERVMAAASIDLQLGDPDAARRLLNEQLDGWDGPPWNGTDSGARWLDRTRAKAGGDQ